MTCLPTGVLGLEQDSCYRRPNFSQLESRLSCSLPECFPEKAFNRKISIVCEYDWIVLKRTIRFPMLQNQSEFPKKPNTSFCRTIEWSGDSTTKQSFHRAQLRSFERFWGLKHLKQAKINNACQFLLRILLAEDPLLSG